VVVKSNPSEKLPGLGCDGRSRSGLFEPGDKRFALLRCESLSAKHRGRTETTWFRHIPLLLVC
jgi:hypothetical protein